MNYIVTKNPQFFKKIGDYNYCALEDLNLKSTIAVDSETTGLDWKTEDMFCIQIGTGEDNYIIDFYTSENAYTFSDVIPYLKNREQIYHNANFDLGFCYKYGYYPDKVGDTFLQSKLLTNGIPSFIQGNDFGSVMERVLHIKYDKQDQKTINVIKLSTKESIQYCFNDVDKLIELHTVQNKIIDAKGMSVTYNVHKNYVLAITYVEQCGAPIDADRLKVKIKIDLKKLKKSEQIVKNYILDNLSSKFHVQQHNIFNIVKLGVSLSSPIQMVPVFEEMGINVLDKDNKKSINKDVINKSKHEFLTIWKDYQDAKQQVNSYGQNLLDQLIDGRGYSSYNQMLDTARISTRSKTFSSLTLPATEEMRACIKAKEGYDIICADYAGQENVVTADLTRDNAMLESIWKDLDLHCAFARMIFPELKDLPDNIIMEKFSKERKYSKAPRFAFAYGGSAYTIHVNQGIPLEEAEKLEKLFKELHAGIYKKGDETYAEAIRVGYITSAGGFRLHLSSYKRFKALRFENEMYTDLDWEQYNAGKEEHIRSIEEGDDYKIGNVLAYRKYRDMKPVVSEFAKLKGDYMRLCLNNPSQTTAAHQTKTAAAMLFNEIKKNNHLGRVLICIIPHDEFVLECEKSLSNKYKTILEDCMKKGGDYFLKSKDLTMKADANVKDDWWLAK
jgi:DNA polymerase I-like protein with 3'-5' exonuclease and polymerase domains